MMNLGPVAFAAPWLLTALVLLPVIWWLLRVTPPAPRRIDFPPLRLLFGLVPKEETPDRTPIWLLLMRMVAAALIILALAQPLLNPSGIAGSSRALGWDTMLPTSSCGTRMSARAFGHTGFTGTSLWVDLDRHLHVIVLSNRVHPHRSNDAIQAFRPTLHNAVMRTILGDGESGEKDKG